MSQPSALPPFLIIYNADKNFPLGVVDTTEMEMDALFRDEASAQIYAKVKAFAHDQQHHSYEELMKLFNLIGAPQLASSFGIYSDDDPL